MKRVVLSLLVENSSGVLSRIAGLFSRRGYNIDSLTVVDVKILPEEASVCRELVLIKVEVDPEKRQQIIAIAEIFRASIVDVAENSVIIELTGRESKLEAFLNLLSGYKILQVARTGITGLARGSFEH